MLGEMRQITGFDRKEAGDLTGTFVAVVTIWQMVLTEYAEIAYYSERNTVFMRDE